jgi:hypothetical protein
MVLMIAQDVRYPFDCVELKKGHYFATAHSDLKTEQTAIRTLLLKLLSAANALRMDVASDSADEALMVRLAPSK